MAAQNKPSSALAQEKLTKLVQYGRYNKRIIEDAVSRLKENEVKLLLAIKLFEDGIVSLGKAAEVAGYSTKAFVEILMHKGIPPVKFTGQGLDEEMNNA